MSQNTCLLTSPSTPQGTVNPWLMKLFEEWKGVPKIIS